MSWILNWNGTYREKFWSSCTSVASADQGHSGGRFLKVTGYRETVALHKVGTYLKFIQLQSTSTWKWCLLEVWKSLPSLSVGRSVGWSVCHNSPKGGKLHLRDIVILLAFVQKSFHLKKKRKKNLFLSSPKALSMPGLQVFFQQKNPKEAKVLKVFLRTFNEKKLIIKDHLELIFY